jgi:hypothetical protein
MSSFINFLAFLMVLASPLVFVPATTINTNQVNQVDTCSYITTDGLCLDDSELMEYGQGTCQAMFDGVCLDDLTIEEITDLSFNLE